MNALLKSALAATGAALFLGTLAAISYMTEATTCLFRGPCGALISGARASQLGTLVLLGTGATLASAYAYSLIASDTPTPPPAATPAPPPPAAEPPHAPYP